MGFFFNFITCPEETIHNISRKNLGYGGFLILILAIISMIAGRALFFGISSRMLVYSLTWGLVARLTLLTFCIFVAAVLYHYFAGIFGGDGDGVGLFKVLPYSFIPCCFAAPATLIVKAFAGGTEWLFLGLIVILLLFWMAFLQLKMINYFYGLSVSSSLAVFILPWIILIGFLTMAPIILGTGILMLLL